MHGRPHSLRSRALLACVPVLGLAMLAGAGTASAARAPVNTRAELRAVLEHVLAGWRPANRAVSRHEARGTGLTQMLSLNWSGYADTKPKGSSYSGVAGKWTEPKITRCKASVQSAALFWVGIDGLNSNHVEQDGSLAECPGHGSTRPLYGTWWEMYPKALTIEGMNVKPGDMISASVTRKGTSYTFKVTDSTTKRNSFSRAKTCAASSCKDRSAEWIAERPIFVTPKGKKLSSLPNFGTWMLASAAAKAGSKSGTIKTFPGDEVIMLNNPQRRKVLALPGALNRSGDSFKDTWKASG
jgi:Peptidase A4 family